MDRSRSNLDIIGRLQKQISDLYDQLRTLRNQNLALPDWIIFGAGGGAPAFQNGWTNYGTSSFPAAGFWRDSAGIVHLKGLVGNASNASTTIATLPAGFRPGGAGTQRLLIGVHAGGIEGRIDVQADGQIVYVSGSSSYVQLDNIHFRAEN